ncbi:glycosyltransferase family 4 protein [Parvularcula oceani]|uniref:glycosyltransferase family 4 protein n=1 Tax=Parvularcula oceani TaxID=1247963 RepID=UPI00138DDB34|nr:glycosyltransferase family 4 protein [Parvularcula oceani]
MILQVNAPEVLPSLHHLGMGRERSWYTVGYWAWELPAFPRGWEHALPFVSDVWAVSDFTSAALALGGRGRRPHTIPHAVRIPPGTAPDRARFALPPDSVIFLTMADTRSSLARKNPEAVISAFTAAFGDDERQLLIVKTRGLAADPEARASLVGAAGGAPNIRIMDESLSEGDRWRLILSCDVMVSLHRSEGFGLPLAEAMAAGRAVLATGWSGNLDFMSACNSVLVGCTLRPVMDAYGVYALPGAQWAEPDVRSASSQMVRLVREPNLRRRLGLQARKDLAEFASAGRVGRLMKERLEDSMG